MDVVRIIYFLQLKRKKNKHFVMQNLEPSLSIVSKYNKNQFVAGFGSRVTTLRGKDYHEGKLKSCAADALDGFVK